MNKPAAARDRPWLMRTYAGHSTADQSNALFRRNLGKGQTGLSVAFDLPTQPGYDAVFTPTDFRITAIIGRVIDEIRLAHKLEPMAQRIEGWRHQT